ncbi:hypothetical protein [Ancylobacter terrae]|uniref:hypothetical protein n=1 Tax=Ancylobacter sp. sgz301288 TaxID=3342077 RepID=UPI0038599D00
MAFDYTVSLQVYHPDADPADIVGGLSIPARRSWKVGDRRSAPNGAELPGHYRETYCLFWLGDGNDGELAKCLSDAVKVLQPKRQYLDWLRETGGRMNFYVGWTVGERGEVFNTRLLSEIAQLGIDLGIEPLRVRQHSASPHL